MTTACEEGVSRQWRKQSNRRVVDGDTNGIRGNTNQIQRTTPRRPRYIKFSSILSLTLLLFLLFNIQPCYAQSSIIDVYVGQQGDDPQLVFSPSVVYQTPGNQVRFLFFPQNHSVAQSAFESPCSPIGGGSTAVGFFSGFNFVEDNADNIPTFIINITTNDPIYYYCAQGRHCQSGMVGIINPYVHSL